MSVELVSGVLADGAVFGLLALSALVSFSWLNFPDLTPDGSFVVGGATYVASVNAGWPWWLGIAASVIAGASAGLITAVAARKLGVPQLVAGLITSGLCYSFAWYVLQRPSVTLPVSATMFGAVDARWGRLAWAVAILATSLGPMIVVGLFGRTVIGTQLRAFGDNELLAPRFGRSALWFTALGLGIGGVCAALAGVFYAERASIADINSGVGATMQGLAALTIAVLLGSSTRRPVLSALLSSVGAVGFRACLAVALSAGMPGESFRAVSGALLLCLFVLLRAVGRQPILRGARWR